MPLSNNQKPILIKKNKYIVKSDILKYAFEAIIKSLNKLGYTRCPIMIPRNSFSLYKYICVFIEP